MTHQTILIVALAVAILLFLNRRQNPVAEATSKMNTQLKKLKKFVV